MPQSLARSKHPSAAHQDHSTTQREQRGSSAPTQHEVRVLCCGVVWCGVVWCGQMERLIDRQHGCKSEGAEGDGWQCRQARKEHSGRGGQLLGFQARSRQALRAMVSQAYDSTFMAIMSPSGGAIQIKENMLHAMPATLISYSYQTEGKRLRLGTAYASWGDFAARYLSPLRSTNKSTVKLHTVSTQRTTMAHAGGQGDESSIIP